MARGKSWGGYLPQGPDPDTVERLLERTLRYFKNHYTSRNTEAREAMTEDRIRWAADAVARANREAFVPAATLERAEADLRSRTRQRDDCEERGRVLADAIAACQADRDEWSFEAHNLQGLLDEAEARNTADGWVRLDRYELETLISSASGFGAKQGTAQGTGLRKLKDALQALSTTEGDGD